MQKPKLTPSHIRHAMQCAAKCDSIITSEEWLREFWYEADWCEGVAMAKFDNGQGDHVFLFFTDEGHAIIKGFAHESEISPYTREVKQAWPGIYEGAPPHLLAFIEDASVEYDCVTFACWCVDGKTWETGCATIPKNFDDGSQWLLEMVQMDAEGFTVWGRTYYEDEFDTLGADGVKAVFHNEASANYPL